MDLIERAALKLKESQAKTPVPEASSASKPSSVSKPGAEPALHSPESTKINQASNAPSVPETTPKAVSMSRPTKPVAAPKRLSIYEMATRDVDIDIDFLREGGFIIPDDTPTRVAEEFRIVKRQLLRNTTKAMETGSRAANLVLVTSTQPGEGKTFCAINLALSLASERDFSVLLVDADVARPQLLGALGLEADRGLIDIVVEDDVELADCLLRTNIDNLSILPAGRHHPAVTELLASDKMEAFLHELGDVHRDCIVIFDSSPVLASSAPSVMAQHVGQTVFVVEAERTRETQLIEALSMISECRHISLMLNKCRFMGGKVRFGSYYEYYRS